MKKVLSVLVATMLMANLIIIPAHATDEEIVVVEREPQSETVETFTGTEKSDGWDSFYNEDISTYTLTYNIDEDAQGDQTIDLTKALDSLSQYADEEGNEANIVQPGDGRKFEINITTDSPHTYKYKADSFVLETPNLDNFRETDEDTSGDIGFDGQDLPEGYPTSATEFEIRTGNKPIYELLYELGIIDEPSVHEAGFASLGCGNYDILMDYYKTIDPDANDLTSGTQAYLVKYYSEKDGVEYKDFNDLMKNSQAAIDEVYNGRGFKTLGYKDDKAMGELPASGEYDNFYKEVLSFVYGTAEYVQSVAGDIKAGHREDAFNIIDSDDGMKYNYCVSADTVDFPAYGGTWGDFFSDFYGLPKDVLVALDEYGDIAAVGFGDGNGGVWTLEKALADESTWIPCGTQYENPSWASKTFPDHTVGDYMTANSAAWQQANDYFKSLQAISAISDDTARQLAFSMALNVDGENADNPYQVTRWAWYNSIKLEQMDGDLHLTKVDSESGDIIANSETDFQIWYIDTIDDENVNMYCTYDIENNSYYFTNTKNVVSTTEGKLDILYTLMKDITYYLQEVAAPEGYEVDPTIYVIMDKEQYDACDKDELAAAAGVGSVSYLGDLGGALSSGEQGLEIKFENTKIVVVPEPEPPQTPEEEEDIDIPEEDVPLIPSVPPIDIPDETFDPPIDIDIPDEDIPLVDIPNNPPKRVTKPPHRVITPPRKVETNPPDDSVDIPDEPVPLAEVPNTGVGHWDYVFSMATGGSLFCLAGLYRMKKED